MRVVLDTETTGIGKTAEIVEIAILDADTGETLYNAQVMPQGRITPGASDVHGLTRSMLGQAGATAWPENHSEVCRLLSAADQVLTYNAEFDQRLLTQTAERYGLALPSLNWRCLMIAYADGRRWFKLAEACKREGLRVSGAHRAESDARMARELWRKMGEPSNLPRPGEEREWILRLAACGRTAFVQP